MWTTPRHSFIDENVLPARNACCGGSVHEIGCIPEAIYLKPGELYAGRPPARITTVLGSCIAITMYDRENHAAAICHALQPACPKASSSFCMSCSQKYRSVRCAVSEMARRMERLNAFSKDLEIKIFGGAALLGGTEGRRKGGRVGEQNIEATKRALAEYGLRVHAMEVGGSVGRKIIFDTTSGVVFLKRIESFRAK